MRNLFRWALPGLADCVLPALFAVLNPDAKPGLLLRIERWLDAD